MYPHKSFFPSYFEHDNVLGRCSFTLTSCLTTHTIITMQIVNFSASNSHFTNESSSSETTQLIIPLTRVLPLKQCEPCLHSSLYSSCCIFCFDCVSSSPRPRTTTRCGKASTCSPYLHVMLPPHPRVLRLQHMPALPRRPRCIVECKYCYICPRILSSRPRILLSHPRSSFARASKRCQVNFDAKPTVQCSKCCSVSIKHANLRLFCVVLPYPMQRLLYRPTYT